MKIKDLVLMETVSIDLVVKTASVRQTKTRKNYLTMELFDGESTIMANNWDWTSPDVPPQNAILTLTAAVSEFAGKKQLNIKSQAINETAVLSDFAPKGAVNIPDYVCKAKELIDDILNPTTRDLVRKIFNDNKALWNTAPGAKSVHHAFLAGTLKHCVDCAIKARVLADLFPLCNRDLLIAGSLLHDFGKLWTYETIGIIVEMTEEGQLLDHLAIGVARLETYKTIENEKIVGLLQHVLASHHGKLEYGSPVTPKFLEAWIINLIDGMDVKAQTIAELNSKTVPGAKFTEKEWSLENRPMLTQAYVNSVMMGDE